MRNGKFHKVYVIPLFILMILLSAPSGWAQMSANVASGNLTEVIPNWPACLSGNCSERWDCCVGAFFRHPSRADDSLVEEFCANIENMPPEYYEGVLCVHGLLCDYFKCKNNVYMQQIIGYCPEGEPSPGVCIEFAQADIKNAGYFPLVVDRCNNVPEGAGHLFGMVDGVWADFRPFAQEGDFENPKINNVFLQMGCIARNQFYQALLMKIRANQLSGNP